MLTWLKNLCQGKSILFDRFKGVPDEFIEFWIFILNWVDVLGLFLLLWATDKIWGRNVTDSVLKDIFRILRFCTQHQK